MIKRKIPQFTASYFIVSPKGCSLKDIDLIREQLWGGWLADGFIKIHCYLESVINVTLNSVCGSWFKSGLSIKIDSLWDLVNDERQESFHMHI